MSAVKRDLWLAVNFAATIFVSAFLLFQVQPLVSKAILPWFGGTAAVWTTCMLFFQTVLFCGYAYAHLSDRWLAPKMQGLVHVGLIVVALLCLRIVPADAWKPQDSSYPALRILGLLTISVGLPYFVLSSTGPLLQAWFARSYPGRTPYRLYALSNLGSLLALLSYPFWFERWFDIPDQARYWSWGFVAYAVLCGYAAISIWLTFRSGEGSGGRIQGSASTATKNTSEQKIGATPSSFSRDPQGAIASPPSVLHRILWITLPAFASLVLLATTNHVSIDVTPMPFLWVIPLSIYLVTFIIAFDHPRWYWPVGCAILTLMAVYVLGMAFSAGLGRLDVKKYGIPGKLVQQSTKAISSIEKSRGVPEEELPDTDRIAISFKAYAAICFVALFGICLLCHGELVRLRPDPRYLTSFYLSIAAGGALGGAAVSLIAPYVFVTYFEWNLAVWLGYLLAVVVLLRSIWDYSVRWRKKNSWKNLLWIIPALAAPIVVVACIGGVDLFSYMQKPRENVCLRARNFFGTLSVEEEPSDDPDEHCYFLFHGRIKHGMQFTGQLREVPTTYYATPSGVGRTVEYYHHSRKPEGIRIGAVGLGTGTMAAYVEKGDSIRFYEINANVRAITEPGRWFTYLQDCKTRGGDYQIEMGDARLSLERELRNGEPQRFHVLVLDAFSGDAIPVHLLTKEAVQIYLDQLATPENGGEHGQLAVHITNRYLGLEPVVLGLANEFKLGHVYIANGDGSDGQYSSDWIILSRNEELLQELRPHEVSPPELRDPPETAKPPILWTDGRSNLIDVLN